MTNSNNRLRLAIQKSGRLSEESLNLLYNCGIYVNPRKEQLFCHSANFPLDLLLVRDDDIPNLILDGICDFAIVGMNVIAEQLLQKSQLSEYMQIVQPLGFAACRLAIAVPDTMNYGDLNSLQNCKIATSYPALLKDFLQKNNVNADIVTLTGSVEIAPRLGIADAICDLVASGSTLKANNLCEVSTLLQSEAVLIKSNQLGNKVKKKNLEKFTQCVSKSLRSYNYA